MTSTIFSRMFRKHFFCFKNSIRRSDRWLKRSAQPVFGGIFCPKFKGGGVRQFQGITTGQQTTAGPTFCGFPDLETSARKKSAG
jgi:hypothetical protein